MRTHHSYFVGDNAEYLEKWASTRYTGASPFDLVFSSPPYEKVRRYEEIDLPYSDTKGWVIWVADVFELCYLQCSGLTAFVVEGPTKKYSWSASPFLLGVELLNRGIPLRKPPIFARKGIPGSGGPDWLRNDYEFIICASHGKLPWSDNTAMGHPPKYGRGGDLSHRTQKDRRVSRKYPLPKKANPGNIVSCKVGGGHMGDPLASQNEAPFPESLVEFFIRSFCPPGGYVLDPFAGSGTTAAVAKKLGRNSCSIDVRKSQKKIWKQRLELIPDTNTEKINAQT